MDEAASAPGQTPGLVQQPHGGAIRRPWTVQEATEASRKGNATKRVYTLRGALAKRLKAKRPDGSRPWDDALSAFVEKLLEGDARAIELAMNSVDGPQVAKRQVEHSVARDLQIRPEGDARGRVVEAEKVKALPAVVSEPESPTSV